jgi:hypothetical protein
LLLYGVMLAGQLLLQQRDPSVFNQGSIWAHNVKQHSRRNRTFTCRLRMEVDSFDKLIYWPLSSFEIPGVFQIINLQKFGRISFVKGAVTIWQFVFIFPVCLTWGSQSGLTIVTLNAMARLILSKLADPMPLQPDCLANLRNWKTPNLFKSNVSELSTLMNRATRNNPCFSGPHFFLLSLSPQTKWLRSSKVNFVQNGGSLVMLVVLFFFYASL